MSETIVTLTGEDASLYRTFQRLMDSQVKAYQGYEKLKQKSTDASDAAVKAANETAEITKRVEQLKAQATEASASRQKQAARDYAIQAELAYEDALAKAREVAKASANVTEESEKAKAQAALRTARTQVVHAREAAAEAKAVARTTIDEMQVRNNYADIFVGKLGAMASGYLSVSAAVNMLAKSHELLKKNELEAYESSVKIAKAQQEATKNMAGMSGDQIRKVLLKDTPEIARETNFSDIGILDESLAAAQSIVGIERARDLTRQSARINVFSHDLMRSTTTAGADLMGVVPELGDAKQVFSLVGSMAAVARPEQLSNMTVGAGRSATAGINLSPTQNKLSAAKEAIALFATLSTRGLDPEGKTSSEAAVQFQGALAGLFNNQKDKEEREDKIIALKARIPLKDTEIQGNLIEAEQQRAIVSRLNPKDTSLYAQKVRNDLAHTEAQIEGAKLEQARDKEELERLTELKDLTRDDPGTLLGRLELLRKKPVAAKAFIGNLQGQEAYKAILRELVDPNSGTSENYANSLKVATTNPEFFETMVSNTLETPQARVAFRKEAQETSERIKELDDVVGRTRGEVDTIVVKALKGIPNAGAVEGVGTQFQIWEQQYGLNRSWTGSSRQISPREILAPQGSLLDSAETLLRDGGTDSQINTLITAIRDLIEIGREKDVQDSINKFGIATAQFQKTQNETIERLNRLLVQMDQRRQETPIPPNQVRAKTEVNQ